MTECLVFQNQIATLEEQLQSRENFQRELLLENSKLRMDHLQSEVDKQLAIVQEADAEISAVESRLKLHDLRVKLIIAQDDAHQQEITAKCVEEENRVLAIAKAATEEKMQKLAEETKADRSHRLTANNSDTISTSPAYHGSNVNADDASTTTIQDAPFPAPKVKAVTQGKGRVTRRARPQKSMVVPDDDDDVNEEADEQAENEAVSLESGPALTSGKRFSAEREGEQPHSHNHMEEDEDDYVPAKKKKMTSKKEKQKEKQKEKEKEQGNPAAQRNVSNVASSHSSSSKAHPTFAVPPLPPPSEASLPSMSKQEGRRLFSLATNMFVGLGGARGNTLQQMRTSFVAPKMKETLASKENHPFPKVCL